MPILIKLTDLMKVKEESEKVGLKLNIHKSKIMASGPITSWEIDGETVETMSDFIFWAPNSGNFIFWAPNSGNNVRLYFLGSKITADGDCSH